MNARPHRRQRATSRAGDLPELKAALNDRALDVACCILQATPNRAMSSSKEARFGRKGSFALQIAGAKCGLWFDHEAGEGGDLIQLIRRETGVGFKKALAWARAYLGWHADSEGETPHHDPRAPTLRTERLRQHELAAAAAHAHEQAGIARALAIWDASIPIYDTPAETYLRIIRGIPGFIPSLTVRFHPGLRAIVFVVLERTNEFVGVQTVALTKDGKKRSGKTVKRSYGPVGKGTLVFFAEEPHQENVAAEGPETGLSINASSGHEVRCTLGSVARFEPSRDRATIVAVDDDPRFSPASQRRKRALRNWRRDGFQIHEAHPWAVRREDKSDFNDLLLAEGAESVRSRIMGALPKRAPPAGQRVGLTEARELLEKAVRRFFDV